MIETNTYHYYGGTILVATVIGDPESDGEDYYADEVYVAWDASLDRPGDVGACTVASGARATWLSLRWPCTTMDASVAVVGDACSAIDWLSARRIGDAGEVRSAAAT